MRIEELSIGDWVCAEQLCGVHNEPRLTPPMKVVGLGESWVNLEVAPNRAIRLSLSRARLEVYPSLSKSWRRMGL